LNNPKQKIGADLLPLLPVEQRILQTINLGLITSMEQEVDLNLIMILL